MKPAPSLCGITSGNGIPPPSQSPRFLVSPALMPDMATRTRTSPGPGSAASISPTVNTSAAGPRRSYHAAFIALREDLDRAGVVGAEFGLDGHGTSTRS